MTVDQSFYLPLGPGRYQATSATVGPWDPRLQHGSPPAALLAHALESSLPRGDARIARMAFDFFGPVAVSELEVACEVVRPGSRIELSRARLAVAGRTALEASAWRIATGPERAPAVVDDEPVPPRPPPEAGPMPLFGDVPRFGYGEAMEWRFAEGAFDALGPATAWARPRIPLLPGQELTGFERLLLMVDSANGISAVLQPSRYTFVPVELTVSAWRHPQSEWVGMRARTTIEPDGIGLTRADLFDEQGFLGCAVQTLFVARR